MALLVVVAAVVTGLAIHRSGDDPSSSQATTVSEETGQEDSTGWEDAVDGALAVRSQAVRRNQADQFLAPVDPGETALLARQRTLFANLRQFGFATLTYERLARRQDPDLPGRYGAPTVVVTVAMTYQLRGIDPTPVRTLLAYTFAQRAGRWLLVSDTDLDRQLPRGSHQEAWDVGPVLVKRGPRTMVVVERGETELARSLLATAGTAVEAVSENWPGGWKGSGVVIALDDRVVRGADYTIPQNAEDALAMATWVYRTLPGEVTDAGERGDSYVVVNPRNRDRVDARILAHEFTHVATAHYGSAAPRWLVEGAATYVEFRPMEGARTLAVGPYRRDVRAKYLTGAKALPADTTFFRDSARSYPLSWLAVEYLFDRYGGTEVATLYQELAALGSTQQERDRIMLEHLGLTETGLFQALRAAASA